MSCTCLVSGPAAKLGYNFHTPLCGAHDKVCGPIGGFGISWKLPSREQEATVAAPTIASLAIQARDFVGSLTQQPLPH